MITMYMVLKRNNTNYNILLLHYISNIVLKFLFKIYNIDRLDYVLELIIDTVR